VNGFTPVKKEDFESLKDVSIKLNILYDYVVDLGTQIKRTNEEISRVKEGILKQNKWYKAISLMAGFVGGFVAGLTKRF